MQKFKIEGFDKIKNMMEEYKNGGTLELKQYREIGTIEECKKALEMYNKEKREVRMTANEYQKLAMRTCSIPYENKKDMMYHAVLGLASEAGEVAGIFQKEYQGHEICCDHVKKELGDCLWMIAEACTAMGFTMEDVMITNIEKLEARFPDGFEAEKSIHRKPDDI